MTENIKPEGMPEEVWKIAQVMWERGTCLLCDTPRDGTIKEQRMGSVFVTEEPKFGARPGEVRYLPYVVCNKCYDFSKSNIDFMAERCEAKILKLLKNAEITFEGHLDD